MDTLYGWPCTRPVVTLQDHLAFCRVLLSGCKYNPKAACLSHFRIKAHIRHFYLSQQYQHDHSPDRLPAINLHDTCRLTIHPDQIISESLTGFCYCVNIHSICSGADDNSKTSGSTIFCRQIN